MGPKWQRARLIINPPTGLLRAGCEFWVMDKPVYQEAFDPILLTPLAPARRFETNISAPVGEVYVVPAADVELLARGPEDFAETVPFTTIEELQQETPCQPKR